MKRILLAFVLSALVWNPSYSDIEVSKINLSYDASSWKTNKGKKASYEDTKQKIFFQEQEFVVVTGKLIVFDLKKVADSVRVYRNPDTFEEAITRDSSFQFTLDEGDVFSLKLQVKNDSTGRIDQLFIRITTFKSPDRRGNPSFLFVSGIRSIGSDNYDNQWVDLNLKKNLLGGTMFLLMSADLSLKKDEEKDSLALNQTRLVEAGMSANFYFMYRSRYDLNNRLLRTAFLGGGIKIFNQQPMYGVHLGVMEVNGPLFTSYSYIGYYRNMYELPVTAHADSGNANYFRNNVYLESALMIDPSSQESEFLQSLSRVRIKLGVLFPFGQQEFLHPENVGEKKKFKPNTNDIQYRIVMEIPLGKIFRF